MFSTCCGVVSVACFWNAFAHSTFASLWGFVQIGVLMCFPPVSCKLLIIYGYVRTPPLQCVCVCVCVCVFGLFLGHVNQKLLEYRLYMSSACVLKFVDNL